MPNFDTSFYCTCASDFKADAACEWNFNTTVAIYGYLVHTHKRGT